MEYDCPANAIIYITVIIIVITIGTNLPGSVLIRVVCAVKVWQYSHYKYAKNLNK